MDPEADAVVDEALEVETMEDAEAAFLAAEDEEEFEEQVEAALATDEVAPYDGPD